MNETLNEYSKALAAGKKEFAARKNAGMNPHPLVLDMLEGYSDYLYVREIGMMEIPISKIVGNKTAGRQNAFSASFYPLMEPDSEFGAKWCALCDAHLGEDGIREPISCYEFYGRFYVGEGNKRVSVLKWFGASTIQAEVTRVMPEDDGSSQYKNYQEFLHFFESTRSYDVECASAASFRKILIGTHIHDEEWNEYQRRHFKAVFLRFKTVLKNIRLTDTLMEGDALAIFFQYYTYEDLWNMSEPDLKKAVLGLEKVLNTAANPDPISLSTVPGEPAREGLVRQIISPLPRNLHVAFIHERDAETSQWTNAHELGRVYAEKALEGRITTKAYFGAEAGKACEALIDLAVNEGADVVFTTTPPLIGATKRSAIRYPNVYFLNCSVNMPYSDIRTYYARMYEGKFILGVIAGILAGEEPIGYVATNPVYGVPAGINAFALGAEMSNPNSVIELEWSSLPGDPLRNLRKKGIHVISTRDNPLPDAIWPYCGLFRLENDTCVPYSATVWNWGKLYEAILNSILNGGFRKDAAAAGDRAINYWWGMDTGVIDLLFSDNLPAGVSKLASALRKDIADDRLAIFTGKVEKQNGEIRDYDAEAVTVEELLKMDWLCKSVHGSIPEYPELIPLAQRLHRHIGLHRDPAEENLL